MLKLGEKDIYRVFKDKMKWCGSTESKVVGHADPTEVEIIKASVFLMYGFTDGDHGDPPAPEIVEVQIIGMYGDQIKVKTSCGEYEAFYEYNLYEGCTWKIWHGDPEEFSMILKRLLVEGEKVTKEFMEYCSTEDEEDENPYGNTLKDSLIDGR